MKKTIVLLALQIVGMAILGIILSYLLYVSASYIASDNLPTGIRPPSIEIRKTLFTNPYLVFCQIVGMGIIIANVIIPVVKTILTIKKQREICVDKQ